MKCSHHFAFLCAGLINLTCSYAQNYYSNPTQKIYNLNYFSQQQKAELSPELYGVTPQSYIDHPELGILPYNAPCTDCVEMIDKRTSNTRQFLIKGTEGKVVWSHASLNDMNYKDEKGNFISIDPRLKQSDTGGVYLAHQQPNPIKLDMLNGFTEMQLQDKTPFQFNKKITAYFTDDFLEKTAQQNINRSNYSAGDEGVHIYEAFTNIDQQLIFDNASVKSNYVIYDTAVFAHGSKYFVIEDAFEIPDGYSITRNQYEGVYNTSGLWYGELVLQNKNGIEMAKFQKPVVYDSDSLNEPSYYTQEIIAYGIEQEGNSCRVKVIVDMKWLRAPERIFPIIIDPLVYGTTTTWTGVMGTDETPNWCTQTLSVPTPANATLTGSSVHWEAFATGANCPPACRMNDIQVQIQTSCGYSPGPTFVWVCDPGCNSPGYWIPTINDATTAALVSCYTPQCNSFNIDFTLYINQFNCVTPGTCVTDCVSLNKMDVIIEGHTAEAVALIDASAAWTISGASCDDQWGWLNAAPQYGVPGYTYYWSPGDYTTDSVFVTFSGVATYTYTLTVTDACGTTATDAVTITDNCLILPITFVSFTGYHHNGSNYLNCITASEENSDYLNLERSAIKGGFETIGTLKAHATSAEQYEYAFVDTLPFEGVNYYRLKEVDMNGEVSYSDMIAIYADYDYMNPFLQLNSENPVHDMLSMNIFSISAGDATLKIYDAIGNEVLSSQFSAGGGRNSILLNISLLAPGAYIAFYQKDDERSEIKLMKQ
ncbi:MAG: hypothetical protein H7X71_02210 [Chitinophagales bacterium]|nr:hypothetical protein [Chitinophagales bacterium]